MRTRLDLELEIVALRHQVAVLQREHPKRLRLRRVDRVFWVWLSRTWRHWRRAVHVVTPDTVRGTYNLLRIIA
jgi:putative transposase